MVGYKSPARILSNFEGGGGGSRSLLQEQLCVQERALSIRGGGGLLLISIIGDRVNHSGVSCHNLLHTTCNHLSNCDCLRCHLINSTELECSYFSVRVHSNDFTLKVLLDLSTYVMNVIFSTVKCSITHPTWTVYQPNSIPSKHLQHHGATSVFDVLLTCYYQIHMMKCI